MASEVRSDPTWSRRDSILCLAGFDVGFQIEQVRLKHGVVADAYGYHQVTTRLSTMQKVMSHI